MSVNFITVDETRFKSARVRGVKPLQEIRTAKPVAALGEQNDSAAFVAGKRRHVERFVRLDEVDVVWKAAATRDHDVSLRRNRHRVVVQVILTTGAMGEAPVAAKDFYGPLRFVDNRVDAERGRDECGDTFAFFVYCVSVEESGADAGFAAAAFEVERKHVRGFNRLC